MTDEDTPETESSHFEKAPDLVDKKGQMLVIYLPEGSVIVDRTDMGISSSPMAIVEQVSSKPKPEAILAPEVEKSAPQPMQATLQEIIQLAVREILQVTGQALPLDREHKDIVETNVTTPLPKLEAELPLPKAGHRTHAPRVRKIHWVHGINTVLVAYLLFATIIPVILSSAFGMAIYASNFSNSAILISKGDLMVCQELPASQIKVRDVLLVRDGNSWRLDARQVTGNTNDGTLSTISTSSSSGLAIDKTYVMPVSSQTYKVSRIIPKLGYVSLFLSSTIVKILGGLSILALNLMAHYRRARRRRQELGIR